MFVTYFARLDPNLYIIFLERKGLAKSMLTQI